MSYHGRNKHDREHDLRRIFRVHINKHRQKALSHIAKQRQRTAQHSAVTERISRSVVLVGAFRYYVLVKQLRNNACKQYTSEQIARNRKKQACKHMYPSVSVYND